MKFYKCFTFAVPMLGLVLACASVAGQPRGEGASLEVARTGPGFANCSKPVWPAEAIRAKHTGTVTMAFLITTDGSAKQSRITRSSGHMELDEAARVALAKCKFTPGNIGGVPVEAWLEVQYVWTLDIAA